MVMEGISTPNGSSGACSGVVIAPPLSLESGAEPEYKSAPNIIQRILSLFNHVRPGSDLTRFELPPLFNLPKSQLQCNGESVYCTSEDDDLLGKCNKGKSSIERFTAVVGWSVSTFRPLMFGLAPFNPILGETHHASKGTLNILLEQVSHHPPVTALHGTDEKENLEMIWCQNTVPKFHGASVEAVVSGYRKLNLLSYGETYVMNCPNLLIRLFPVPGTGWSGNVRLHCEESGLEAELCYKGSSFLRINTSITGKIFESSTLKPLFEIKGCWDSTVAVKNVNTGEMTVIYDAKQSISRLKTPQVKDPKGLSSSESAVVWNEVNRGILNKEWDKAREAKRAIEEKQREADRERKSRGETWSPKHFNLSYTKEQGWDCSPKNEWVPPAPIVAP